MKLEEYLTNSAIEINKKTTELQNLAKEKGLPYSDATHFRREATIEFILTEIYNLKKEISNGKPSSNNARKRTSK